MAATLFYLVGNSDLAINSQTRFAKEFRIITEQIWREIENRLKQENGKKFLRHDSFNFSNQPITIKKNDQQDPLIIKSIGFPIFFSLWNKFDPLPRRIILFFTDQKQPHSSDTLFAAKMLKFFIENKIAVGNIVPELDLETIDGDPSDYDMMARYFSGYFFSKKKLLNASTPAYFCLSSGTPAMISQFALNTLDFSFCYFYVSQKPDAQIQEVRAISDFNRRRYAEAIKPMIECYQYQPALELVKRSPFRSDFKLLKLLEACHKRYLFEFSASWDIVRDNDYLKDFVDYFEWIADITLDDKSAYIREMVAHIEIAFKIGELHTGIALLFNLLENFRDVLLKRYAGIRILKANKKFPEWETYIKSCGFFNTEEQKNILERDPNRVNKLQVLKAIQKNKADEMLRKSIEFLDGFEKTHNTDFGEKSLLDLRNQGPFAHGQQDITSEVFEQIWPPYGSKKLVRDLYDFFKAYFDLKDLPNPFDQLNNEIFKLLGLNLDS